MGAQNPLGNRPKRPTPAVHEVPAAGPNARSVFRAPPGWPPVPQGWTPPAGWTPDPTWPPAPENWVYWETAGVQPTQAPPTPLPGPPPPPPQEPPLTPEHTVTARKKILIAGLGLVSLVTAVGAIWMVSAHGSTINSRDDALAVAEHHEALAQDRLAVATDSLSTANERLAAAEQASDRARSDEAAAAAGETTTASMNPMVEEGLAAAWDAMSSEDQSSVCSALETNADDVAQAAAAAVPDEDAGIVTQEQVLEFYQGACEGVPTS
jgi:hypothetical protein